MLPNSQSAQKVGTLSPLNWISFLVKNGRYLDTVYVNTGVKNWRIIVLYYSSEDSRSIKPESPFYWYLRTFAIPKLVKNKACFSLFIVVSSHQGQSTAAVSRHDSGTSNIIRSLKVIKNYFLLVVTLTERKLLWKSNLPTGCQAILLLSSGWYEL